MKLYSEEKDKILKSYSPRPKGNAFTSTSVYLHPATIDLSVIVPCYNSQDYLNECIVSIASQVTKYSFEIIAVNDGSTDNTRKILTDLASKYSLLKVIDQRNKGFSGARNTGIRTSQGRYIMFVDSDDYITDNYIESLMCEAITNNVCLVACGYYTFRGKRVYKSIKPNGHTDTSMLNGCLWGKVFRRELFEHIVLPEGYWYEDSILAHLIYPKVEIYRSIDDCQYAYRSNPKGITISSQGKPKSLDTFYITDLMLDSVQKYLGIDYFISQKYYDLLIEQFYINQRRILGIPTIYQKEVFRLQSNFVNQVFKGYQTSKRARRLYERALQSSNYRMAILAAKMDKAFKVFNMLK